MRVWSDSRYSTSYILDRCYLKCFSLYLLCLQALVKFRQGAYGNLKVHTPILNKFRSFSSQDERHPPNILFQVEVVSSSERIFSISLIFEENLIFRWKFSGSSFVWPETKLGVLEPKDSRFPLPGLVGSDTPKKTLSPTKPNYEADVLTLEQNHERQSSILEQFLAMNEVSCWFSNQLHHSLYMNLLFVWVGHIINAIALIYKYLLISLNHNG